MKAMSTPSVSVPPRARKPPTQMTSPSAVDATISMAGQEQGEVENSLDLRLSVVVVDFLEAFHLFFLAAEELYDLHACDVLLQK